MIVRTDIFARHPADSAIDQASASPPTANSEPAYTAGSPAAASDAAPKYVPLIVVCALLGVSVFLMVGMVSWTIVRRYRRRAEGTAEDYLAARRRDPTLTWDEYERSRKLTHSTVMLEEERLRVAMIDKSLRSRVSIDQTTSRAPSIPEEPVPASPRARTSWMTGRLRRQRANSDGTDDFDADDKEMLLGGASPTSSTAPSLLPPPPPHSVWGDVAGGGGTSSSASPPTSTPNASSPSRPSPSSSQRWLWELPDGKKCPPAWANSRWGGDTKDAPPPVPPASLRTRTPPIWAHPAFRPEGGAGAIITRSFTNDTGLLPSELARVKPASLV